MMCTSSQFVLLHYGPVEHHKSNSLLHTQWTGRGGPTTVRHQTVLVSVDVIGGVVTSAALYEWMHIDYHLSYTHTLCCMCTSDGCGTRAMWNRGGYIEGQSPHVHQLGQWACNAASCVLLQWCFIATANIRLNDIEQLQKLANVQYIIQYTAGTQTETVTKLTKCT